MTLEEWDTNISHHLGSVEYYSKMVESHARELAGLLQWETNAEYRLALAEDALMSAAERVRTARKTMREKPHVA